MRVALFYHSLLSDWNHGNAHFLRGIAAEFLARGHEIRVFEPENGWSRENLLQEAGPAVLDEFRANFPQLTTNSYCLDQLHLDEWLDGVDLVLVHEWNEPYLVEAVGAYRARHSQLRAFFHDTHHRAVTAPDELARFSLDAYDGVLAYGQSLQAAYRRLGWGRQVHVWHEAADTRVFYPRAPEGEKKDVVWIGNWGDEERTQELRDYLLEPIRHLQLSAQVYGVRYPASAQTELAAAEVTYSGWLPNYQVPTVFAGFRATVHVPRRPYTRHLPGIPTIRPFEALACGIPLVSAPWNDSEGLFRVGQDFLMAENPSEMRGDLRAVCQDKDLRESLALHGLETIRQRHTCGHRVEELLAIYERAKPQAVAEAEVVQR